MLPVIAPGAVLTLTIAVRLQPVGRVYTTRPEPGVPPVTTPDEVPTVIMPPVPVVLHVPPASYRVVVEPEHSEKVPNIGNGNGLTVNCAAA